MKLNLGCGGDYKTGWINTDINKLVKADYYFDLGNDVYPFKNNSFDRIEANSVFEHLQGFKEREHFLKEIYRVGKEGCKVVINVPHFSNVNAYSDIQHTMGFSSMVFNHYNLSENKNYAEKETLFDGSNKIYLNGVWKRLGFEMIVNNSWFKRRYETYLAFFMTANNIVFDFRIVKGKPLVVYARGSPERKRFYDSMYKAIKKGV
jgi:predicted SAM-dependent methyltransferase